MKNYKNILCVIPARAGSQGIIDKNIKLFDGYPLFIWSIAAALESKYINHIVVSSDYLNLDNLYEKYFKPANIEWQLRPPHLCTSTATTESCLNYVIDSLKENFDYVVTLQPTSPIRKNRMIDDAFDCMLKCSKKTLLSAKKFSPFFLQKLPSKEIKWHYDRLDRKMRQELGEFDVFWHDDGSLYITDINLLMSTNCRLDNTPYVYPNDELASEQIDTELDFVILEKIKQELPCANGYISPEEVCI
ncbi:MAG: acylneuraminate cytidylyltransferase family protein [Nitrosopumilus sp.]